MKYIPMEIIRSAALVGALALGGCAGQLTALDNSIKAIGQSGATLSVDTVVAECQSYPVEYTAFNTALAASKAGTQLHTLLASWKINLDPAYSALVVACPPFLASPTSASAEFTFIVTAVNQFIAAKNAKAIPAH